MWVGEKDRRSEEEEESVCMRKVGEEERKNVLYEREKEIERRKENGGEP